MDYDVNAAATATTNELFYRNGSQPEAISTGSASFVKGTIAEALLEAYNAGFNAAVKSEPKR